MNGRNELTEVHFWTPPRLYRDRTRMRALRGSFEAIKNCEKVLPSLRCSPQGSTYLASFRRCSKRLSDNLMSLLVLLRCLDSEFCAPLNISSPICLRFSIFDPFSQASGHMACSGNFVRTRWSILLTTIDVSRSSCMTLDISCGIAV